MREWNNEKMKHFIKPWSPRFCLLSPRADCMLAKDAPSKALGPPAEERRNAFFSLSTQLCFSFQKMLIIISTHDELLCVRLTFTTSNIVSERIIKTHRNLLWRCYSSRRVAMNTLTSHIARVKWEQSTAKNHLKNISKTCWFFKIHKCTAPLHHECHE